MNIGFWMMTVRRTPANVKYIEEKLSLLQLEGE
jgi:hypothetical protein